MEQARNIEQPIAKKNVQRSPNYPAFALDEAIKKVKVLWDKDGRAGTPRDVAVKHLNYSRNSGPSFRALATLKSFGLTFEKDARIFLTKDALDIAIYPVTDVRYLTAVKTCALKPKIYRDLYNRYITGFPSADTLRSELVGEFKFNRNSVDGFLPDFEGTLKFAGLWKKGNGEAGASDAGTDENADLSAAQPMETALPPRSSQVQVASIKFEWTLAPGTTARLLIEGIPSDEDRDFLKFCLERAIKKLAEFAHPQNDSPEKLTG